MLVAKTSVAFVAWLLYSWRVQKSVQRGDFALMEILSESRDGYGDPSRIPEIARRFGRRASATGGLPQSFELLLGTSLGGTAAATQREEASIRVGGDVAVRYTEDGLEWALYGRRKATRLGLRELVAEKTTRVEVEEDFFKRMNWGDEMNACVPIKDLEDDKECRPEVEGSYLFCHRDYVNSEELRIMMRSRGGIQGFLLKLCRPDAIDIGKDSKCVMTEKFKLLNVLPIFITREGKLEDGTINWYTSSLRLGWKKIGKYFDKPSALEKIGKDPWHISTPKEDPTGDILRFDREGKGHLVFARQKCLLKGVKSQ